ncbi:hypothetical protein [Natrinema salaciae]|uniref:Uncharacterized protein n=1 Tax=Natrinema salaciae TaxID=1186196 RepID=A0A1H9SGC8_9EURY|nr:hypothetical protein [Natrinema salaciae]SER84086.1 hypothetical protein SAMN04489841_4720 [Natrinema salaciae]
MDPKRSDVRLDDAPDEDGIVTRVLRSERSSRSLIDNLREYLGR